MNERFWPDATCLLSGPPGFNCLISVLLRCSVVCTVVSLSLFCLFFFI